MNTTFSKVTASGEGDVSASSVRLLLLASQIYGVHGGMAAYMRRLVEIFSAYCARTNGELTCLGMPAGPRESVEPGGEQQQPSFVTVQRGRIAFTRTAVRLARAKRVNVAVAGYLGVAPVTWLLFRAGIINSYIVVLHGTEAWERVPLLHRIAVREASLLVSTTRYTADTFGRLNQTAPERARVMPLGLADSTVPELSYRPASGPLRVLTVGRLMTLEGYKGVDTLIRAVAYARSQGRGITLDVVGQGDDVPRLRRLCSELAVNDAVQFLGALSGDHLETCYRECDVFAMPSKGEGFGIVFLEAMRWGKPCIGGNHGGIPEVIDDGVTGYLIDYGDHVLLAEHLGRLAREPQLRYRMGRQGQDKVARVYLFPHLRDRWFNLLDEAAGLPAVSSAVGQEAVSNV